MPGVVLFCKAEARANKLRLDRCSAALCTCRGACRQVCRVRDAGWWLVRARNTTTNNSTTAHGSTRSALLALLCGFSPALLLPRRPIRRSYALHRPASFCTAVRCYKLAAAQLYCGAYNKAVGCPEARLSHPRIQRSYALYPPGVCDRLGCILPLPPSQVQVRLGLFGWLSDMRAC